MTGRQSISTGAQAQEHHLQLIFTPSSPADSDVWVGLYGREFADAEVVVESARKGYYDYEGAWRDVLALTESERLARWEEFLASRRRE